MPRAARVMIDPRAQRSYHYWHAFVPGIAAGQIYGFRADGPLDPRAGIGSIATRCCSIRTARAWRRAGGLEPRGGARAGRQHRDRDEERRGRSGRLRLGGGPSAAHAASRTVVYEMHVRGFTRHPSSGVAGRARHLSRRDREDSVPAAARRHRRGAAAGLPVRRAGVPPGGVNYWGYQPVSFFAPHPRYSSGRTARPGRRVPRHGEGAASRRHRGDPRRGLQPHGRRRRDGPTLCFRGLDNSTYYILGATRRAMWTSPAAATRSTPTIRSSAA